MWNGKERITKEQFGWLLDKGIIHEGMTIFIMDDDATDYRILEILWPNRAKTPQLRIKNMDTGDETIIFHKHITGIEDMSAERFVQAYEVDDEMSIINVVKKTNVEKTIIGKKTAKINGVELVDGVKILLHNDVNPKLCNKPLSVKGVGNGIKLVAPRGRPKKIR